MGWWQWHWANPTLHIPHYIYCIYIYTYIYYLLEMSWRFYGDIVGFVPGFRRSVDTSGCSCGEQIKWKQYGIILGKLKEIQWEYGIYWKYHEISICLWSDSGLLFEGLPSIHIYPGQFSINDDVKSSRDGVPRIHIILGGSHLTGSFLRAECKFHSLRIECIVVYLCLHVRRTRMK